MAKVDVIMPQMGESIAEGTLTKWLKQIGENIERDEDLFEISTDKVDADIPSPSQRHAGRDSRRRGGDGRGEHDRGAHRDRGRSRHAEASAPAPAEERFRAERSRLATSRGRAG